MGTGHSLLGSEMTISERIRNNYTVHDIAMAVYDMNDDNFYEFFMDLYNGPFENGVTGTREQDAEKVSEWIGSVLREMYDNYIERMSFHKDAEKMEDFVVLSKERFLESYSYLTEAEYDATLNMVRKMVGWERSN